MQSSSPKTQLLRNIYLLCAVSAITCAGLVTVFGWQHLRQHDREACESRVHTNTLALVAELQGKLLGSDGEVDSADVAGTALRLTKLLAENDHALPLAQELQQAWVDYGQALSSSAMNPSNTAAAKGRVANVLERIREHSATVLQDDSSGHTGDRGSTAHWWLGSAIVLCGGCGVAWLVTAIVRSERNLLQAQATLEERVAERTTEIARQNVRLSDEVAQRRGLEQEILTIAAEEQRRIAGWLHDDLGQRLTGLSLTVKALERELSQADPRIGDGTLTELGHQIRAASQTLRMNVRGLFPTPMTRSELISAVESLALEAEKKVGCQCHVDLRDLPELSHEIANVQIYGIVREAMANATRHAAPTELRISISNNDGELLLSISDDGCGFNPDQVANSGVGLRLIRYRTDVLRGKLSVRSAPGNGTRIHAVIPLTLDS